MRGSRAFCVSHCQLAVERIAHLMMFVFANNSMTKERHQSSFLVLDTDIQP